MCRTTRRWRPSVCGDRFARVVGSVLHGHGPLHHGADAVADPSRGLRLLVPNRGQDSEDVGARDLQRRSAARTGGTRTARGSPASPVRASDCASRSASAPPRPRLPRRTWGLPGCAASRRADRRRHVRSCGWRRPGSAPPSARREGTRRDRARTGAHRSRGAGSSAGCRTDRLAGTVLAHRSSGRPRRRRARTRPRARSRGGDCGAWFFAVSSGMALPAIAPPLNGG